MNPRFRMTSVYYHIPKCGGTSIGENAKLNLGRSRVHSVYRKRLPLNLAAFEHYHHRKHTRLIKSHIPFGSVPSLMGFRSFTILRKPERRIVSLMQDVRTRPSHYLFNKLGGEQFSVGTFLQKAPPHEIDNILVRYLIGEKGFSKPNVDETDLQEAVSVLQNGLTWFGFQEDFETALSMLAQEMGFRFVTTVKKNASLQKLELRETEQAAMAPCLAFDDQLYKAAEAVYAKRMAENPLPPPTHINSPVLLAALKATSFFC